MRKALFLLLIASCGDNARGVPFEELDALANSARCERLVRCGLFPDDGSCTTYFRKDPKVNLRAAIERKIVQYDGVSAERCEQALAALSCNELERDVRVLPEACRLVFRGTRAVGATCAIDEECKTGLCEGPGCPEGQCCTGVCAAQRFAALGQACETDRDCLDDLQCSSSTCQPLVKAGGECRSDRACDYGHACVGANQFMPGNCRKLPLIGEPCPYMRCAEIGAACISGTCHAVGLPGDPCTTNTDCSQSTSCGAEQRCVATPSLGQPCVGWCAGESWCGPEGRCVAPLQDKEACSSGEQCASLVCVDGPVFETCIAAPICIPE